MKIIYAHIIIIDDNDFRRRILAQQLQNEGYAISTASSAERNPGGHEEIHLGRDDRHNRSQMLGAGRIPDSHRGAG